jgi:hypothetical protein
LALLLTIFVLLQYRDLRDRAVRLMGTSEIGRSTQAFDDAASDLGHYLMLQAAVNVGFGTFVGGPQESGWCDALGWPRRSAVIFTQLCGPALDEGDHLLHQFGHVARKALE